MKRLAFAFCLIAICLTAMPVLPALAAPDCQISPISIDGMMKDGVNATMQAVPGRPCGAPLWVQKGVIGYTALQATRQPMHGHLKVNDPTQFTYTPDADYQGSDKFEILARGDGRGGGQVTGQLKVDVNVSRGR